MSIELRVRPNGILVDELVDIFRLFCEAYGTMIEKSDERFLRGIGIESLHKGRLDYRCKGGKFFGERRKNSTVFWGYTQPNDPKGAEKNSKFEELVQEYYSQKNEHPN